MADESMASGPEAPRRKWAAIAALIFLGLSLMVLAVYWLKPPVDAAKNFGTPKITSAFVDEEPFMRLNLKPGDQYRPIELMQGTRATVECFVVKVEGISPRFVVSAFGQKFEKSDCVIDVPVPDNVGQYYTVRIEYFNGSTKLIDSLEIPVVTVARDERVEFHQLQDTNHVNVLAGGVPEKFYVYGRAITSLPGNSDDYAALFFTADPENDVPVVQMMPLLEGEKPRPLVGIVKRYRSYGKDLSGYALWSPEPLTVSAQNRKITDLYIGVFKKSEIDSVFGKLLKVESTSGDTVTVSPLVTNPYDVMRLTVNGKLLSQAFHVVSGSARVGIDEKVRTIINQQ